MTQQHPISPPPELVQQWWHEAALRKYNGADADKHVTSMAAQWGADQELEACCEWLKAKYWIEPEFVDEIRASRRPKPPSLKEQSITLIDRIQAAKEAWDISELETIRRALEQLPDHE
jgi:hypothetical protein